MSDQYVAEIRIFACNFAPNGWAFCNGQLMAISRNTALFSLLGTTYGGDGKSTFGLPNLQGQATMNWGSGPGLSERYLGEMGGSDNVTLLTSEMPAHIHTTSAKAAAGVAGPGGVIWGVPGTTRPAPDYYAKVLTAPKMMHPLALSISGGSLPHNNLMPYQTLNFCIALQGIFPPRG